MNLGLGSLHHNKWLDDFLVKEGYEQKTRLYHTVNQCWCGSNVLTALMETT